MFRTQDWCFSAGCLTAGPDGWQCDEANTLAVLWVRQGRCALAANQRNAGSTPGETGDILLAACPATLTWHEAGFAEGVLLGGAAPLAFAANLAAPTRRPAGGGAGVTLLLRRLVNEAPRMALQEASALAYALLCQLDTQLKEDAVSPLVVAATAHIQANYAEVYGIEELAQALEVSKSHLIRRFTAETGTSPGQYLTFVRVEAVKRLLLQNEHSLDIIASLCGFSGAGYLCKVFRRHTGESPAAWRRHAACGPLRGPQADEWLQQAYL